MSSAREHKDPCDYTYEELKELSRKPREELNEVEEQALAKSRFCAVFDKKSMDEETWEITQKLKKYLETLD